MNRKPPLGNTLVRVLNGDIHEFFEEEKQKFLSINNKLSPSLAGDKAAALIAARFYREGRLFEEYIRNADISGAVTDEDEQLYDKLNANRGINSKLSELSGSRTLISDIDTIELEREEMVIKKLLISNRN